MEENTDEKLDRCLFWCWENMRKDTEAMVCAVGAGCYGQSIRFFWEIRGEYFLPVPSIDDIKYASVCF